MKTIAFFVRNIDAEKYPFSVRDLYYHSYQEYLLAIKQAGANVFFVTDNKTYQGNGKFNSAWSINKVSEVANFKQVGPIVADLIFNKGGFEGTDIPTVTDLRLHTILGNKINMYEQFKKYQPKSAVVHNADELKAALLLTSTEMAVVKNPESNGGKQVYIGLKKSLQVPGHETYPLLVQEFVDMSAGVKGLANGVHDVRVLMAGNKIIGATLRQPKAGKLHSNVSQGGTEVLLSVDQIPQEVRNMAYEIDSQLPDLPRYYAQDFAKGKNGWILMELNKQPGLFRANNGPLAQGFINSFARYIVGLV